MSERGELLTLLVDALACELAPRVAAELARTASPAGEVEPWRLLDLEEAAARLGRSTRTVRAWAKAGLLMSVKLDGGALAFELADLQAFAAARRVGDVDELAAPAPRRLVAVDRGWAS